MRCDRTFFYLARRKAKRHQPGSTFDWTSTLIQPYYKIDYRNPKLCQAPELIACMRISRKQSGANERMVLTVIAVTALVVFMLQESDESEIATSSLRVLTNISSQKDQAKGMRAILKGDLLDVPSISAEKVWDELIQEGSKKLAGGGAAVAMEVGMHRPRQCLQAAEAGLTAHCFEPSPVSFQRVQKKVKEAPQTIQSRIHLYNAAAGSTAGILLNFTSSGGTGDHVGEFDVWNMKAGKPSDEKLLKKQGKTVQVPSIRLDDVVEKIDKDVFVMKIDTQGFEPAVLSGLTESLRLHKVQFLLMEYWPAGIDLMSGKPEKVVPLPIC